MYDFSVFRENWPGGERDEGRGEKAGFLGGCGPQTAGDPVGPYGKQTKVSPCLHFAGIFFGTY